MALLSLALNIEPYLAVIAVIVFGGGGILRMVYALMFEYGDTRQLGFDPVANTVPAIENQMRNPALIGTPASTEAYEPPRQGTWMDTNDLTAKPPSVTDHTTKLLTKDEDQ
ncbi:MAG: hypothetical protein ACJ72Z_12135 [Pyrinomonadaceae bacterium]